jgi:hypothetical protein
MQVMKRDLRTVHPEKKRFENIPNLKPQLFCSYNNMSLYVKDTRHLV